MRVELAVDELTQIHKGKRIAQFFQRGDDPCEVQAIGFTDGSVLILNADFEERAKPFGYVAGKAPIYVRGEQTERRQPCGLEHTH